MESYKEHGLLQDKYIVKKSDCSAMDPDAKYFVLRIDKDPNAVEALRTYAENVQPINMQFAQDIYNQLEQLQFKGDKEASLSAYMRAHATMCGKDHQIELAVEELAEVTKALQKYKRHLHSATANTTMSDLAEEIADAEIMLFKVKHLLGINNIVDHAKQIKARERIISSVDAIRGKTAWTDETTLPLGGIYKGMKVVNVPANVLLALEKEMEPWGDGFGDYIDQRRGALELRAVAESGHSQAGKASNG